MGITEDKGQQTKKPESPYPLELVVEVRTKLVPVSAWPGAWHIGSPP